MLRIAEEAARTDTGRQRQHNEDSYFARSPVFAVADGMGGARAGEVASRLAAETFEPRFDELQEARRPEEALRDLATDANRRIYELAQADEKTSGMGTTLTAAYVGDRSVSIAHVGDSRAYLYRNGKLKRLTRDHSLVEELRRQGRLTEEEAEDHPQRSIITRALGPEPEVDIDTHTHRARDGDVFLLCSDGLTTMVSEERLAEVLAESKSLDVAARALVKEANAAGGKDNITVIAFRVADTGEGSDDLDQTIVGGTAVEREQTETADAPTGTLVMSAEQAEAERAKAEKKPTHRLRRRLLIALAVVALLLVGTVAAAAYGVKRVYFIGTDDRGLVTIYRGLPYDVPGGIKLYSSRLVSSVPVRSLPQFRQGRLLDHQLRSRQDATLVVRRLERQQAQRTR